MNYFKIVSSDGDIDPMSLIIEGLDKYSHTVKYLSNLNECIVSSEGTPTGIKDLTTTVTTMTKTAFNKAMATS